MSYFIKILSILRVCDQIDNSVIQITEKIADDEDAKKEKDMKEKLLSDLNNNKF